MIEREKKKKKRLGNHGDSNNTYEAEASLFESLAHDDSSCTAYPACISLSLISLLPDMKKTSPRASLAGS